MNKPSNITSVNSRITILSDILQKARSEIEGCHASKLLPMDITRKIVIFCLLYICKHKQSNSENISLSEILSDLRVNSFETEVCLYGTDINLSKTMQVLDQMFKYEDWRELINYSLEALEYGVDEYFGVEKSRGTRNANKKKKTQGIFYTPTDVVSFMTSKCLFELLQTVEYPTILDCSCGSGIFLLQSQIYLEHYYNPNNNFEVSIKLFKKCIWGVDISPAAIDCCKSVFVRYFMDKYSSLHDRLGEVWEVAKKSFVVGDATQLGKVINQNMQMPCRFDCIIGNPPYVSQGRGSNLFLPFVDNMRQYSSKRSYSALVLPLSVCYSQGKDFISLRERIQNDMAEWVFLNYDRSPDSLFGDQVKTRNTLLFRQSGDHIVGVKTSTLQRWTSVNRSSLFLNYQICSISNLSISEYVPKISFEIERNSFYIIRGASDSIMDCVTAQKTPHPLVLSGTAYNWICAYDHEPPSIDENGMEYISSSSKIFYLPDAKCRDFSIAVLCNRIAYWYWIAIADGFHINSSFLLDYHIGPNSFSSTQFEELSKLGNQYSNKIILHPTVSHNAGKTIVNYSHWDAMEIVKRIEIIISDALKLPDGFIDYLSQWYYNHVNCNRDMEKR